MVRYYFQKFVITFTVTLCSNFKFVMFEVRSDYLALEILKILCKCFSTTYQYQYHKSMFQF